MKKPFFEGLKLKRSEHPKNFIPAGATPIVGMDPASDKSDDKTTLVKGYVSDGVLHIQEIVTHERSTPRSPKVPRRAFRDRPR